MGGVLHSRDVLDLMHGRSRMTIETGGGRVIFLFSYLFPSISNPSIRAPGWTRLHGVRRDYCRAAVAAFWLL